MRNPGSLLLLDAKVLKMLKPILSIFGKSLGFLSPDWRDNAIENRLFAGAADLGDPGLDRAFVAVRHGEAGDLGGGE